MEYMIHLEEMQSQCQVRGGEKNQKTGDYIAEVTIGSGE
jgi:hypothetical protein